MSESDGPFARKHPEVHLERAPLVRVLCQVQWPEHTLLSTRFSAVADEIGTRLSDEYPLSPVIQGISFELDAQTGQVRPQAVPAVRQWVSVDDTWSVYFAPTFVTLENRGAYTSREDMTQRFARVLSVVFELTSLPAAQRVGWRYVNRIEDPLEYADLGELVHATVLGAGAVPAPSNVELVHSFTESLFRSDRGNLLAKWGFMPPNATHDASLVAVSNPSWVLDIDAFDESRSAFEPEQLLGRLEELTTLAYGFFRWSVKESFIDRFGG
ncbi:TIGR04255 family protein [Microbacterium sp. 69-7]|uniref:TIGR04255 family protein n=1 Tax=Microbacterium sp. 69-7 TaxID=1895784 RepID=UPI00258FB560|nr:TIGR04255 family protein [Microbacterium sp. 69-7]